MPLRFWGFLDAALEDDDAYCGAGRPSRVRGPVYSGSAGGAGASAPAGEKPAAVSSRSAKNDVTAVSRSHEAAERYSVACDCQQENPMD
jgi:hypothetical protein